MGKAFSCILPYNIQGNENYLKMCYKVKIKLLNRKGHLFSVRVLHSHNRCHLFSCDFFPKVNSRNLRDEKYVISHYMSLTISRILRKQIISFILDDNINVCIHFSIIKWVTPEWSFFLICHHLHLRFVSSSDKKRYSAFQKIFM